MSKNENSDKIPNSVDSTNKVSDQSPDIVDMLLSKKSERVFDSDSLIQETQKRVWASLKTGYEYEGIVDESEEFLRANVLSKMSMMVLYVDLVGSTTMTLEFPGEKVAIIVSSFAQEMASLIKRFNGLVLKFVGDAVIGYFLADANSLQAADNAVNCAKTMMTIIEKGINPILSQYDYPTLRVKVGIDYGKNIIIRYGSNEKQSHVDIMGPAMNIASKIQGLAKPNQILIGDDVFTRTHPTIQKQFRLSTWNRNEWSYRSTSTGKLYNVYEYTG